MNRKPLQTHIGSCEVIHFCGISGWKSYSRPPAPYEVDIFVELCAGFHYLLGTLGVTGLCRTQGVIFMCGPYPCDLPWNAWRACRHRYLSSLCYRHPWNAFHVDMSWAACPCRMFAARWLALPPRAAAGPRHAGQHKKESETIRFAY